MHGRSLNVHGKSSGGYIVAQSMIARSTACMNICKATGVLSASAVFISFSTSEMNLLAFGYSEFGIRGGVVLEQ